ncbi:hypothetical protein B0H10DRAFT_2019869 [Mycena sp. CBHHK59/15]|nr:hypothetical protein B0H10DRAFT_2119026 [Mycena sp. CBHHK59/15]KAJ6583746.1 hypothetical protein B0H10DRAFT_2096620 [Mycena sp. CBHHK59/15]KAJ6620879.1 hypothetical protein B0H10DRAFT_2019869 [Mycena sp. CBHHK59/15]
MIPVVLVLSVCTLGTFPRTRCWNGRRARVLLNCLPRLHLWTQRVPFTARSFLGYILSYAVAYYSFPGHIRL